VKTKFSIVTNVESYRKAIVLIVNGFSKDVLNKLPMEFAVEAQKLLEISLEDL
jgi:Fe-S cluster assembly scaffold protein SufB